MTETALETKMKTQMRYMTDTILRTMRLDGIDITEAQAHNVAAQMIQGGWRLEVCSMCGDVIIRDRVMCGPCSSGKSFCGNTGVD